MKSMGNAQAKKVYEANVPDSFIVPREGTNGHVVENWIRAKYEKKLFMTRDNLYKETRGEKTGASGKQRRSDKPLRSSEERRERESKREQERVSKPNLIDIDETSKPVPPVSAPVATTPAPAQSRSALLEELFTPATETKPTITRSMDKNSIMSLYNHPPSVSAVPVSAPISRTFMPNYNVHLMASPYPGTVVMAQPGGGYSSAYPPVYTQSVNYSPYLATARPY